MCCRTLKSEWLTLYRGRTSFIMTEKKIISLLEKIKFVEACMESFSFVSPDGGVESKSSSGGRRKKHVEKQITSGRVNKTEHRRVSVVALEKKGSKRAE